MSPPNHQRRYRGALVALGLGVITTAALLTPALGVTDNVIQATDTAKTAIVDTATIAAPDAFEATTSIASITTAAPAITMLVSAIAIFVIVPVARRRRLAQGTALKNRAKFADVGGGELMVNIHDTGPMLVDTWTAEDDAMAHMLYDETHDVEQLTNGLDARTLVLVA